MASSATGRSVLARIAEGIDEQELEHPTFITPFKLVWHSIRRFFTERPGQIIGSAFLLIMLWGYHGELELLTKIWPEYVGPGRGLSDPASPRPSLIPGIPWDDELISFFGGGLLLVVVPMLLIKFVYRGRLSDYGLGLPPKGRRALAVTTFLALFLLSLPAFWLGTFNAGANSMQSVYPFYRPFSGIGQFLLYEATYIPFFIAIEFIFRGYLLFGLAGVRDSEVPSGGGGVPGRFYFHRYAILIQMLSYTAWHLGKPIPELWGTVVWGLAAGSIAYAVRSIWGVTLAHFLLNVVLDYTIADRLGLLGR